MAETVGIDLVTNRRSCCCSDCADTTVHPVVEGKCLDATGDHCFPVPNAKPFAFSDPKIPKRNRKNTTRFSLR